MSNEALFVLALTGVALVLFVAEWFPTDVIALITLVSLGVTGILDLPTLFSGFGHPVVLTLIGIFMLTSSLYHTGVMARLGNWLYRLTERLDNRLLLAVLLVFVSVNTMMMNAVASVALVAPIGRSIASRRNLSPSRLLMPLAFGALLGNTSTLLANINLLISGLLDSQGLPSFGLLDFMPIGGPITLVGILYLTLVAPRLLPDRSPGDAYEAMQKLRAELPETYRLSQRIFSGEVSKTSPLVGKTLTECEIGQNYGLTITALIRGHRTYSPPDVEMALEASDWLMLQGKPEDMANAMIELELAVSDMDERGETAVLVADGSDLAEVALSPHTALIGRTLADVHFREKYRVNVLAIWHNGQPIRSHLATHRFAPGDAMLVQGEAEKLSVLVDEADYLVMTQLPETPDNNGKGKIALGIMFAFLITISFKWLPVSIAALIGAIAVIVTRCVTIEQARSSIQWQTIFLIGGMLPLAIALEQTGATARVIDLVLRPISLYGPEALLMAFFILTMALAQITSGAAATLIMGPLAISTALSHSIDPRTLALAVAFGAGSAFLTPISHAANLMVMGLGGYRFRDYAKVGAGLVVIMAVGVFVLVPLVYPF